MKQNYYVLLFFVLFYGKLHSQCNINSTAAGTGTTVQKTVFSDGKNRPFSVYIPNIYNTANVAVPLIINMHGLSGTRAMQANYHDFRPIADTANFIVVHPEGFNQSPFPLISLPGWSSLSTSDSAKPDMYFIMRMLDKIVAEYNIDNNRIYLTGFSQGGYMTYGLGCSFSSRFAAIAPVAGSLSPQFFSVCNPDHPMPVMEIHGTNDGLVNYYGNGSNAMPADTMVRYWVNYNHCDTTPVSTDTLPQNALCPDDTSYVIHRIYGGGDLGTTVEFYKIIDGGHQVPSELFTDNEYGTGLRNRDFTAAKAIWSFFRKYTLNAVGGSGITIGLPATGIEEQSAENAPSVYPNPSANGIFTISNTAQGTVKVVNVLGKTVYESACSGTASIDLSAMPKGIYLYSVTGDNGSTYSGKIIIE